MKITIPGSIRSKKNSKQPCPIPCAPGSKSSLFMRYKNGIVRPVRMMLQPSAAYRKWENGARDHLKRVFPKHLSPFSKPVSVKATFFYKGPCPDLSGCCESLGDCIEGLVIENDKQIGSWDGSRLIHDKNNPRTEIEINEMPIL